MIHLLANTTALSLGILGIAAVLHWSRLLYRDGRQSRRGVRFGDPGMLSVHVRGDSVHLVPGDIYDHAIDRTGDCACRPSTSPAQGMAGRSVLFVDHHARKRPLMPADPEPTPG